MAIEPWPLRRTESLGGFRIFQLRRDFKQSPRTGAEHDFYVLECPGWVNVVALTSDQQAILVEQYRHGTNTVELEIPGGVMDPQDASPEATAVRELREETGYAGDRVQLLASVAANPAIQDNLCHVVLIEGCELRHPTQLDHGEDLVTRLVPAEELPRLVAAGRIRHSLCVAALHHFALHRAGPPAGPARP